MDVGAHTVHNLYYHIVWIPKYRRHVLDGKVGERVAQVIIDVAAKYGYVVDELKVNPDHIHLLVKLEPRQVLPDVVRTLKSLTARALFEEFSGIKQYLWNGSLWASGYCVNTVGGLDLEAVRHYIREEQEP